MMATKSIPPYIVSNTTTQYCTSGYNIFQFPKYISYPPGSMIVFTTSAHSAELAIGDNNFYADKFVTNSNKIYDLNSGQSVMLRVNTLNTEVFQAIYSIPKLYNISASFFCNGTTQYAFRTITINGK